MCKPWLAALRVGQILRVFENKAPKIVFRQGYTSVSGVQENA
jgi:hypothetical protein